MVYKLRTFLRSMNGCLPFLLVWIILSKFRLAGGMKILEEELGVYNEELRLYLHLESEVAWNLSLGGDPKTWEINEELSISKNLWRNKWCQDLLRLTAPYGERLTSEESRQIYLTCRGPRFTSYQLSQIIHLLTKMQNIYSSTRVFSMKMEPDLNRFMETCRNEERLRSAWSEWHRSVGTDIKPLYIKLVRKLNRGARNSGRQDFGQVWREETETPDLKSVVMRLFEEVKPLYQLLHTYVRFNIAKFYKTELPTTIPAHLLGNMWAQKWDSLIDIIYTENGEHGGAQATNPLLDQLLGSQRRNLTALDLAHKAEEFYISMGFPRLPQSFYEKSFFTEDPRFPSKNCHGTAANMFALPGTDGGWGDYRVMMCVDGNNVTDEDLVTLTHEMGHVYYFMAYSDLKPIFQDGANSAFHESVGDAVTYGLKSSRDDVVRSDVGTRNLLKVALARLPQIGFGLVMDLWRWHVFENENDPDNWNSYWWQLHHEILGVSPPSGYESRAGLDAGGKYHIVENVPYIRYFLSSFLQLQFFEALCEGLADLNNCQLRGSRRAGAKLWKMMQKGSSEHWSSILKEMTGSGEVRAEPLLKYFQPLRAWLEGQVALNGLTVGWGPGV